MEEYRLGICDRDTGYMLGLMDYMNMCRDIPFQISVFTNIQDISRDAGEGRVDMLLVDEAIEVGQLGLPVLRLTESREAAAAEDYIFKYQSMNDISAKLLKTAKKKIKSAHAGSGGFVAVYSPVGRSGVSNLALKLACENENSLLVKLENFRSTLSGDDDAFMYYLISRNDSIVNIIRTMQRKDGGYKIVEGPLSYLDVRELKRGDIEWLKGLLEGSSACEAVIFDIGSGAMSSFDLLLAFDKVYVPCIEPSRDKTATFKRLIGYGSGGDFDGILKFIEMEA